MRSFRFIILMLIRMVAIISIVVTWNEGKPASDITVFLACIGLIRMMLDELLDFLELPE